MTEHTIHTHAALLALALHGAAALGLSIDSALSCSPGDLAAKLSEKLAALAAARNAEREAAAAAEREAAELAERSAAAKAAAFALAYRMAGKSSPRK